MVLRNRRTRRLQKNTKNAGGGGGREGGRKRGTKKKSGGEANFDKKSVEKRMLKLKGCEKNKSCKIK